MSRNDKSEKRIFKINIRFLICNKNTGKTVNKILRTPSGLGKSI